MRIAIVGAGPAGLYAALALDRIAGHRVELYERAPALGTAGAGLLLQPTGLAALAALGLRERIEELGSRVDRLLGTSHDDRVVLDLAYADIGARVHGIGIVRSRLHETLSAAVASAGIAVRLGAAVDGLDARADGVALHCGAQRLGRFDLVVLADGVGSILRAPAGLQARVRPYPWAALWATLPAAGSNAVLRQYYRGAHQMLGLLPSGGGLRTLFWSIEGAALPAWREAGLAAWHARARALAAEAGDAAEAVRDPAQLAFARYADVRLRTPWNGRVVAIGDCAHATSPQLGQGVNLALLDGLALARALAAHADPDRALPAWARRRRDHVRYYQFASRLLTPWFQSNLRALPWLRDRVLARVARWPWIGTQFLHTLAGTKTGILRVARDADDLLRHLEFPP